MMFEEYRREGSSGAVELQMDLMNPFNAFELVRDPSLENLLKSAYMPSMAYLGYYGASALVGEAGPGFWVRQAISYEATKSMLKAGARFVPTVVSAAPYAVGGAVVGGTIYAIETGDTTYTIQHQTMMPAINWWLRGLGKNDTRGGSEYGLFYNP